MKGTINQVKFYCLFNKIIINKLKEFWKKLNLIKRETNNLDSFGKDKKK